MIWDTKELARLAVMGHRASEWMAGEPRRWLAEFVGLCHMAGHDGARSGHARETAKRHARTSLRLPDEL